MSSSCARRRGKCHIDPSTPEGGRFRAALATSISPRGCRAHLPPHTLWIRRFAVVTGPVELPFLTGSSRPSVERIKRRLSWLSAKPVVWIAALPPRQKRLGSDFTAEPVRPPGRQMPRLAAPEGWTFVAVAEHGSTGRLLGCVWLEVVDRVPRPIRHADEMGYVTNVYVERSWRNKGIGTALLARVVAEARARGFAELLVRPSDVSIEFYRRSGFVPSDEVHELPTSDSN